MTTQTTTNGGSAPDFSAQVSLQDWHQDSREILAAAQKLRSEAVGRFLTSATRYVGQKLQPVVRSINGFFTRRHEMAELMRLNDRELADIGLSRGDIYAARRDRVLAPANENLPRSVA